jgi:hypothetical protein
VNLAANQIVNFREKQLIREFVGGPALDLFHKGMKLVQIDIGPLEVYKRVGNFRYFVPRGLCFEFEIDISWNVDQQPVYQCITVLIEHLPNLKKLHVRVCGENISGANER